jgi:hypothetical protein
LCSGGDEVQVDDGAALINSAKYFRMSAGPGALSLELAPHRCAYCICMVFFPLSIIQVLVD